MKTTNELPRVVARAGFYRRQARRMLDESYFRPFYRSATAWREWVQRAAEERDKQAILSWAKCAMNALRWTLE
jgi:hypothetical protein